MLTRRRSDHAVTDIGERAGWASPVRARWVRLGWRSAFIIGFVALQVWLPLRYYLGDDRFDERFAWRMFSPVRPLQCRAAFYDETAGERRRIPLREHLHAAWLTLVGRARPAVIEAFARRWCGERAAEGADPVLRLDLTCQAPAGAHLALCEVGPRDGDGDGLPDGLAGSPRCAGRTPAECYRDECGDRPLARCFEDRCLVRPYTLDRNLCDPNGGRS